MAARTEGRSTLARIAEATPATRDRYVDFLRALAIGVVVLGHWLMAIVTFEGGEFGGQNALNVVRGTWVLTWVLQVMPLFFFVGGFSNLVAWDAVRRRGGAYPEFLAGRAERLLRPTIAFVAAWTAIAFALEEGFGVGGLARATELIAKPLWFLAVYVLVVSLAPPMLALHRRFGLGVPLAMSAAAVVVDVARIATDTRAIGYLNFAFVWLVAHQLGFFYADGSLVRAGRRAHAALAASGLAALVALTQLGPYAPSMVGSTSKRLSNNSPPSVCLVALTIWLVGLAMLARPRATRWLAGRRAWTGVVAANSMIMTVFMWHLTAMMIGVVVLFPLGFPQPTGGSARWWALRPAWVLALGIILVPIVALMARFERAPRARRIPSDPAPAVRRSPLLLAAGVAAIVFALAGYAEEGFTGMLHSDIARGHGPIAHAIALAAGTAVLLGARRPRSEA